ncbi:transglutaminase-like domain-containing protein [Actinokineospora bangkokensis]|uniref:Transglutaminase-like domain-containing protein n=1 Tax=Actinokineospora bangkokensis TaxID=1193682 RepID=A0A1Q9LTG1_9PSEU|nr:transglutaminase-like domain-containing protein [Actinokineospora bangkokensis]OLR95289.1 hypothetical protein BJP25_07345 [Actinokineospora bangkokensis]
MTSRRLAVGAVLVASVGPALLFAPVFGVAALLLPLLVVVVAVWGAWEAASRWAAVEPWRPVLALAVGLLGLVWTLLWGTTVAGLPTGATVQALAEGVGRSWQLTLQSTWPARPDAELLLFVPLAALVAAVVAVEVLVRGRWPLAAVVPGLAVLVLSQTYSALTGVVALVVGVCFAAVACVLVAAVRAADGTSPARHAVGAAVAVVLALVAASGAVALDPADRPAFSLRQNQNAPVPPQRLANPLTEVAERLLSPDQEVFRYTADGPVDRWRLVVLDEFDGANWSPGEDYRRMGTRLAPDAEVTAPTDRRHADVVLTGAGPWLPSQALPADVSGPAVLVDQTTGALLAPDRGAQVRYGLGWWEPRIDPDSLYGAGIDPHVRYGGVGAVPPAVAELARKAVRDLRPTFRTALVLEDFLSREYAVATDDLPTGAGWPQLERFLLRDKRGTSEQFAAAYVVLARVLGVPARIAVGYRAPAAGADGSVVVHNGDVLAWPEVAVDGVGWVPLDPSGTATGSGGGSNALADVTAQARAKLPPPEQLVDPEVPEEAPEQPAEAGGPGLGLPLLVVLAVVVGLAVVVPACVPVVTAVRAWRRRRRGGKAAVVGAWAEARDRLGAHGVAWSRGMTVRDLVGASAGVGGPGVETGLRALADAVDRALWSGEGVGAGVVDEAWGAVRDVRKGLARRPLWARVRAATSVWGVLGRR